MSATIDNLAAPQPSAGELPVASAPERGIATRAVQGAAWNLSTGVGARVIQLAGTLVLARFIAPSQYGEVSAAAICVFTAANMSSFFFGQYLIARRAPPDVAFQAAEVHVGLGVVSMAAVYLLRHRLGALVDAPGMAQFVPGFVVAQLLDRVRHVPERIVLRDLRFRTFALVNGTGEITYTATALSLAVLAHWGGHAMVAGSVARSALTCVLFLTLAPRCEWLVPSPLNPQTVRALMVYGTPIMLGALSDLAATSWDNLIMSRLFGPAVMGRYALAYSLASLPIGGIAEQIGDVLMPSFSRADPAKHHAAVIRSAGLMALILTPIGVGLGSVAPTVVAAFFDARWAPMAPMAAILSVMAIFRPITWPAGAILQARQRTRPIMVVSFIRTPVLLVLVAVLGSAWGPYWACAGPAFAYATGAVIMIMVMARAVRISAIPYLAAVARPLAACIPMFLSVLAVRTFASAAHVRPLLSLGAEVAVGIAVYVVACFVFAAPIARDFLKLVRASLGR